MSGERSRALYRAAVDDMAPRYLGRAFTAEDGLPSTEVDEAQGRLGVAIPAALAYYYQRAGRCDALNARHNQLSPPSELRVDGDFLVFMEENQSVVSWGFRTTDCREPDPPVWQRNNAPPHEWHPEERTLTALLTGMFDWYVEMGLLRRT